VNETSSLHSCNEQIEIDYFRSEDAPGIARLIREVYGEAYPVSTYYFPELLIQENAAGGIISSVARTSEGEVVAHVALLLVDPSTHLYESVAGAVLPAFRGQRVFPRVFRHSIVEASKSFGVEGIIGEPVCSHVHTQKMCLQLGFRESGLEVDLLPAAADVMNTDPSGRVSVLLGYFIHKPRVQVVHIPPAYRDELQYLYRGLDVERTFLCSEVDVPVEGVSQGSMKLFDAAQVARSTIDCIGLDFGSFISRLEGEAREKGMEIFQIWLPLASPSAPGATDILRGQGYFLGGVQPCWVKGDGLMMQKVSKKPNWEGIALYSERARHIEEIIRSDWKRVNG